MLSNLRTIVCSFAWTALALPLVAGQPQSVVRIDRPDDMGRDPLIEAGIPVVAELSDAFLAVGDLTAMSSSATELGLEAVWLDVLVEGSHYALAGMLEGGSISQLAVCGDAVWQDDGWVLLRSDHPILTECFESPHVRITPLLMEPLSPTKAPPEGFASFAEGPTDLLEIDDLVVDMVASVDTPFALAHWEAIVGWATTRYSTTAGCQSAAEQVYGLFDAFGLDPTYQNHTSGHAPNIIGTIPGRITPEQVYIVIGHLDDMPSSGSAPGADDNASGSAMVTALAQVMSDYDFASTIRFVSVTGEEWGLYGSTHYAAQAAAVGEQIEAVLNADMIGWEGNGTPNPEDLDINYNTSSAWLGGLMEQVAADYPIGLAVNAFQCNDMAYSDHWPFWQRGWSGICAITDNEGFCGQSGSYPYYHTSADTIANCGPGGPDFLAAAIRLFVGTAGHLADPLCRRSSPPSDLNASGAGDHRIDLAWSAAGNDLVYEIRRAPGGCAQPGPETVVGETTELQFSDTSASGQVTYGYTVRAKDASGYCLSGPSACVEAATTGSCTEPPAFAGATGVEDAGSETCRLTVQWSPPVNVYCGGEVAYNVYRSTVSPVVPGPSTLVASEITGLSFDDFDVLSFEPNLYVVRALDLGNGAEDSNTVEVSGSATGPPVVGSWTDTAGDVGSAALDPSLPWHVAASGGHDGPMVYRTGPYSGDTCSALTTPPMQIGSASEIQFWSTFDIEDDWDKGVVEISVDGGATWSKVDIDYPGYASNTGDACGLPAGPYFTGSDAIYDLFSGSLASWSDHEVIVRWRLASDGWIEGDGWWVDDIVVTDTLIPGECTTAANPSVFTDGFESGDADAWSAVGP